MSDPEGRTPTQQALADSPAAWRWFLLGYESGVAAGYAEGYRTALQVFDAAAALMVETMPPTRGVDIIEARAVRAAMLAPRESEDLDERHRQVAASWGLEAGAA